MISGMSPQVKVHVREKFQRRIKYIKFKIKFMLLTIGNYLRLVLEKKATRDEYIYFRYFFLLLKGVFITDVNHDVLALVNARECE